MVWPPDWARKGNWIELRDGGKRRIVDMAYPWRELKTSSGQMYYVVDSQGRHYNVLGFEVAGATEPPDLPADWTVGGLMEWLDAEPGPAPLRAPFLI